MPPPATLLVACSDNLAEEGIKFCDANFQGVQVNFYESRVERLA